VKLAGNLKQPPEFFLRLDPASVAPCLDPDHTLTVKVRFVQPGRDSDHDDQPPPLYRHVLRERGNRAAHVLGRGIRHELIDAAHVGRGQPRHRAVVGNP
jgi:hypothetical protein